MQHAALKFQPDKENKLAELNYPGSGIPAVQGIPDELHTSLKVAAAMRGMTMKKYILEVLQNAVSETIAHPNGAK